MAILILDSEITFIKNKSSVGIPNITSNLSNNFNVPTGISNNLDADEFTKLYENGQDVAITFKWVNNVILEKSFRNLTQTAKITLPRNLDFQGLNLMRGSSPLFGRGDRVIIKLGYKNNVTGKSTIKEVFRGYITKVGLTTPLQIECEDMMFALKQMKVLYPDTINGEVEKKINLQDLLKRIFTSKNNKLIAGQNIFVFPDNPNKPIANTETNKRADGLIPIVFPSGLNTAPFSFSTKTEKSIAEVLNDLHKKLFLVSYFDDFGNLRVELPYMNSQVITNNTKFEYEKQVIDDSNMKFQREDEMNMKVRFESKQTGSKKAPLYGNSPANTVGGQTIGYIGSAIGDEVYVHGPEDLSQEDCDKYALMVYTANTYTGWVKGSSFETFGEPAVYLGAGVDLHSEIYPEKNGRFAIVGVTRHFGLRGFRQKIELGIQIGTTIFDTQ